MQLNRPHFTILQAISLVIMSNRRQQLDTVVRNDNLMEKINKSTAVWGYLVKVSKCCIHPPHGHLTSPYRSTNDDYSDYSDPLPSLNYVQLNLVRRKRRFILIFRILP